MSNYVKELETFRGIILDEANGFVDQDVVLTVGNHTICLEINADLFDNIDMLIVEELKRVDKEQCIYTNNLKGDSINE